MKVVSIDTHDSTSQIKAPRGSNQSGMRAYNERLVMTLIRQSGALAKAEIARKTGLSAQTVSVIMRALEADGLLEKGTPVRGKVGQPSIPFRLAENGAFFFGLKVGRRSLDLILTNFLGVVQHRIRVTHPFPTPDNTIAFTRDAIEQILSLLPDEHQARIAGMGIALPFQLWDWADTLGAEASDMEDWRVRDLCADLAQIFDFPVFVCNDASAACGAELVFGTPDKPRDFLYFFVGFFIGGGLVLDGTVYTGQSGNAAALGSIYVPSVQGGQKQLVDIASLATLERAVAGTGYADQMVWNTPSEWALPHDILETWLTQAAQGIGHAILSSVCLIDVNQVLIDGWLPEDMRADLVHRVRAHVHAHAPAGIAAPHVLEGSIGSDARALGAASLPLSERFLVERNTFLKGPVS